MSSHLCPTVARPSLLKILQGGAPAKPWLRNQSRRANHPYARSMDTEAEEGEGAGRFLRSLGRRREASCPARLNADKGILANCKTVCQLRTRTRRRMMFRKTLLTASASAVLGMMAMMPTGALAQFGPPPGPPPGLAGPPPALAGPPPGLSGPPPGLAGPPSGLGGPNGGPPHAGLGGPRFGPGGGTPRFSGGRGFEGRSAASAYGYARSGASGYGGYGSSTYGYGRWGRYGYAAAAAAGAAAGYGYGSSYASSDYGCYYTSTYRRGAYRRVLVCNGD